MKLAGNGGKLPFVDSMQQSDQMFNVNSSSAKPYVRFTSARFYYAHK